MLDISGASGTAPTIRSPGWRRLSLHSLFARLTLLRSPQNGMGDSHPQTPQPPAVRVDEDISSASPPQLHQPTAPSGPALHAPDAHAIVDALYQQHARTVLTYLYHRLPTLADAEDALADVFVAALRSSGSGHETLELAWLLAVARRRIADFYRQRTRSAQRLTPLDTAAVGATAEPGAGPEEAALRGEERRQLLALVAQLPEEQQDALALRFVGGLKSPQIAAILGKSEEATRAILSRATRRLRKEWTE